MLVNISVSKPAEGVMQAAYMTYNEQKLPLLTELLNGKKGSIVAIEPGTGEVLAFINNPDYDPNTMVGRDRANTFKSLLRDPQKPLYNRAVKGVYRSRTACWRMIAS